MGEGMGAAQPARIGVPVTHCNTVSLVLSARRSRERAQVLETIAVQHNSGKAHWAEPNTRIDHLKTVAEQRN